MFVVWRPGGRARGTVSTDDRRGPPPRKRITTRSKLVFPVHYFRDFSTAVKTAAVN